MATLKRRDERLEFVDGGFVVDTPLALRGLLDVAYRLEKFREGHFVVLSKRISESTVADVE
ncbi:hypothetical protein [Natronococcus sp. JC468]|uniref:hypothetical protein n=1 Tax=Natronococcus sp. JC468 TaxID=1961921 RepID=UPI001FD785C2|nr:hypothetical protein [Natronococcus sp. JC468]